MHSFDVLRAAAARQYGMQVAVTQYELAAQCQNDTMFCRGSIHLCKTVWVLIDGIGPNDII